MTDVRLPKKSEKTREQRLDELLDKQEITELLTRYTYGCDRLDEDLLRSVYTEEAYDNHGRYKGDAATFAKWATDFHRSIVASTHLISNILIEVDGDQARAVTYVHIALRIPRQAPFVKDNLDGSLFDLCQGGRYIDKLERINGEWKIASRTVSVEWHREDPVGPDSMFEVVQGMNRARRDETDLAYQYLNLR